MRAAAPAMTRGRSFDRLAPIYEVLERLAFGGALHRARTAFLDGLTDARDVLLVGDGDGRGLEAVLVAAPNAKITSVDASAAMLARAQQRAQAAHAADRVTFIQTDVRTWPCPRDSYDAVLTMFVLDCFADDDVEQIAASLSNGLRPDGQWLSADFAIPAAGFSRLASRAVVGLLYAFFRWQTGIPARALAAFDAIITSRGLRATDTRISLGGLLRSTRYVRPARPSDTSSTPGVPTRRF